MTNERYEFLFNNLKEECTPDEAALGWHFCDEWDFLLVGPGMAEFAYCSCDIPQSALPARDEAKKKHKEEMEVQYQGCDQWWDGGHPDQ